MLNLLDVCVRSGARQLHAAHEWAGARTGAPGRAAGRRPDFHAAGAWPCGGAPACIVCKRGGDDRFPHHGRYVISCIYDISVHVRQASNQIILAEAERERAGRAE